MVGMGQNIQLHHNQKPHGIKRFMVVERFIRRRQYPRQSSSSNLGIEFVIQVVSVHFVGRHNDRRRSDRTRPEFKMSRLVSRCLDGGSTTTLPRPIGTSLGRSRTSNEPPWYSSEDTRGGLPGGNRRGIRPWYRTSRSWSRTLQRWEMMRHTKQNVFSLACQRDYSFRYPSSRH